MWTWWDLAARQPTFRANRNHQRLFVVLRDSRVLSALIAICLHLPLTKASKKIYNSHMPRRFPIDQLAQSVPSLGVKAHCIFFSFTNFVKLKKKKSKVKKKER